MLWKSSFISVIQLKLWKRERSKRIKSRLLSSCSHSTAMSRTDRSAQCRSIPNKPKQTINNGGRCVAIDIHDFANLNRYPNTANPTCSCLNVISNMVVQSFCRRVGHGNPAPSPWRNQFFLQAQQCFGATYEPLFLVRSWCFGCRKTKNRFETRLWLRTSTGTALVEKGYERPLALIPLFELIGWLACNHILICWDS